MDFLQSLNLSFCQSHTAFFLRHWTQTHSLLFSLLTLCLIAALVQFHHVLINEKTYFLILAGSAFYLIYENKTWRNDKFHGIHDLHLYTHCLQRRQWNMNSMKLVIPLHSLSWPIHTKDESKRGTAFAFIFGVNWLWRCGVTGSFGVFFHEIECNGMTNFMEFMRKAVSITETLICVK